MNNIEALNTVREAALEYAKSAGWRELPNMKWTCTPVPNVMSTESAYYVLSRVFESVLAMERINEFNQNSGAKRD